MSLEYDTDYHITVELEIVLVIERILRKGIEYVEYFLILLL